MPNCSLNSHTLANYSCAFVVVVVVVTIA